MVEAAVMSAFQELKGQEWHTRDGIHVKSEGVIIQGITAKEPETGLTALFVTVMIPGGPGSFLVGRKLRVISSSDGEKWERTFTRHGGVTVLGLHPGLYTAKLVEE